MKDIAMTAAAQSLAVGMSPPTALDPDYPALGSAAGLSFVYASFAWIASIVTTLVALFAASATCIRQGKRRFGSGGGAQKYADLSEQDMPDPAVQMARTWLQMVRSARAARTCPPNPSKIVPSGILAALGDTSSAGGGDCQSDGVSMSDCAVGSVWDVDARRFEVELMREDVGEDWGLNWNVGALARRRLVLTSVNAGSPAGRWNDAHGEADSSVLRRGDKLVSVNGTVGRSAIEKELATANRMILCFLRLEVSAPAPRQQAQVETQASPRELPRTETQTSSTSVIAPLPDLIPIPGEMIGCRVKNSFIEFGATSCEEEERHAQSDPGPMVRTSLPVSARSKPAGMSDLSPVESECSDDEIRRHMEKPIIALLDGDSPVLRAATPPPIAPAGVAPATPPVTMPPTPDASAFSLYTPVQPSMLNPAVIASPDTFATSIVPSLSSVPLPFETSFLGPLPSAQPASSLSAPSSLEPMHVPLPSDDYSRPAAVHVGSYLDAAPSVAPEASLCSGITPESFAPYFIGKSAWIAGLVHTPEFNGKWCTVEDYDTTIQRFIVRLTDEGDNDTPVMAKIRAENLIIPPTFPQDGVGVGMPPTQYSPYATLPPDMTSLSTLPFPMLNLPFPNLHGWYADPSSGECPPSGPADVAAWDAALQLAHADISAMYGMQGHMPPGLSAPDVFGTQSLLPTSGECSWRAATPFAVPSASSSLDSGGGACNSACISTRQLHPVGLGLTADASDPGLSEWADKLPKVEEASVDRRQSRQADCKTDSLILATNVARRGDACSFVAEPLIPSCIRWPTSPAAASARTLDKREVDRVADLPLEEPRGCEVTGDDGLDAVEEFCSVATVQAQSGTHGTAPWATDSHFEPAALLVGAEESVAGRSLRRRHRKAGKAAASESVEARTPGRAAAEVCGLGTGLDSGEVDKDVWATNGIKGRSWEPTASSTATRADGGWRPQLRYRRHSTDEVTVDAETLQAVLASDDWSGCTDLVDSVDASHKTRGASSSCDAAREGARQRSHDVSHRGQEEQFNGNRATNFGDIASVGIVEEHVPHQQRGAADMHKESAHHHDEKRSSPVQKVAGTLAHSQSAIPDVGATPAYRSSAPPDVANAKAPRWSAARDVASKQAHRSSAVQHGANTTARTATWRPSLRL